MGNNIATTWQENYKIARKFVWVCSLTSVVSFLMSEMMSLRGIVDLFQHHFGAIGSFLFGLCSLGCFIAQKTIKATISEMDYPEKEVYEAWSRKMFNITTLFIFLLGASLWVTVYFDQSITMNNVATIVLAMFGIIMTVSAIFANHMARKIKLK